MGRPALTLVATRLAQILLGIFVFVGLWQLTVTGFAIPKYLAPTPLSVAKSMIENRGIIASQTGLTLGSAALGLTISAALAVAIALAFSVSRTLSRASLPVVLAFRSMPVAAVAPIMMLMLGRGVSTSVAVVTIVSFFPMLVNVMRGLQSADGAAAELLHVYGATRWQQLRLMRIPFAMPYLFTGLRVAGSSAILGAMLSEWITGSKGLGNLILESGDMREIELLWGAVITSVLAALLVFWSTSAAEQRLLRWTHR